MRKTKTISRVGLSSGRINWEESLNMTCVYYCEAGFHGKVIASATGLTVGQVYNRCHKLGIKLRDYRDGETSAAKVFLEEYSVKNISSNDMKKARKHYGLE